MFFGSILLLEFLPAVCSDSVFLFSFQKKKKKKKKKKGPLLDKRKKVIFSIYICNFIFFVSGSILFAILLLIFLLNLYLQDWMCPNSGMDEPISETQVERFKDY